MTYLEQANQLTRRYNEAIRALEDSYNWENTQQGWNLSSSYLKKQYAKKYDAVAGEYRQKHRQLLRAYQASNPEWTRRRRLLGWLFVVGIVLMMGSCLYQLPVAEEAPSAPALQTAGQSEERYWNADNIPIPYLTDATQYVSNPDHVLAQPTVDSMNVTLGRLEHELGVQSVVIVVNHIENDDPYRLAQDVGNKYGVGRHDRGLMVVVGYQDHSVNISPGRALEADLTDAECHRLEQRYVVPAMRREMPDSAMLYLTRAVYATLEKKDLPAMVLDSQADDDIDDAVATVMGAHFLLLLGWCILFLWLNGKYQWLALLGAVTLLSNPFYEATQTSYGGGGFGGGGGSFGGGGFSGGSFGGGSFGGGGATSRW